MLLSSTNEALCNHQKMPAAKLMVCTSTGCEQKEKVGCQNCFLLTHIHNDLVEFKRMEELNNRLQPLKEIAADRIRLEDKIEEVYATKLRKFEDSLKTEKSKLKDQLDVVLPSEISTKVMEMTEGKLTDVQLYREVCSDTIAISPQAAEQIKQACRKLEEEIKMWEKPKQYQTSSSNHHLNGLDENSLKRDRPHQLQEPPNDKKQFKKQTLAQQSKAASTLSQSSIEQLFSSIDRGQASKPDTPVKSNYPSYPMADKSVQLSSYQAGVRYLEDVQYDVGVDISVNEAIPPNSDIKTNTLTKFIHTLCRLEKVENLRLRIGKATNLTPSLLKKIDDTVGCLPRLQYFQFEGWSSEPNCKASNFFETRKRLRNDRNVVVCLRRLDFLIE